VRTVEKSNLSFVIGSLRIGDKYVETCFFSGEFIAEVFDRHVFGTFDNPKVESFALYHDIVLVAKLFLNLSDFFAGESGNDTVNES
jgi:hypothetical protein